MIRVDLSTLVLIALLLMMGPIVLAWLLNEYRRSRREKAAFQHVLHCRLCSFEFEDQGQEALSRCPRCGSLNERFPLPRL
jgi:predicted Zn-ribbon and HTH transcriptional regulator